MGTGRTSGRKRSATGNYISNNADDADNTTSTTNTKYQSRRRDASSPELSNSEISDANQVNSRSQSQEFDDDDNSGGKSKSASLSPPNEQQKNMQDDTLEQLDDLWSEDDINTLTKLVYNSKSLEVTKVFPEGISVAPVSGSDNHYSRSMAETKALLERLAKSSDTDANNNNNNNNSSSEAGSSSKPTSTSAATRDQGELLAILASERAFLRTQRKEGQEMLDAYKKIKGDVDAIKSGTATFRLQSKRATEQSAKEVKLVKKLLDDKRATEKEYKMVQENLAKARDEHLRYTAELNTGRTNALETKRKLDKIRLKIAATRGEMKVIPTTIEEEEDYDALYRAYLEADAAAEAAEGADGGIEVTEDGREDKDEKMEDVDKVEEANGCGDDTGMKDVNNENNETAEEKERWDEEIGFSEDSTATEIRLLTNRLNMYHTEEEDWNESLEAMKMEKMFLTKANNVLVDEMKRGHGGTKRRGAANDSVNNANDVDEGGEKEIEMETEIVGRPKKRSRKGIPTRRIEAGEGVEAA